MAPDFQPLIPGAPRTGAHPGGRVSGAAGAAGRFTPLGAGKTAGPPGTAGRSPGQPASPAQSKSSGNPAAVAHESASGHRPAVTQLIRDGDRITHIEVRCSCGEVITIECGY